MREIKFRGIAVSDDKFCYGLLTKNGLGGYQINELHNCKLVDTHSIGQFTGLTDKNGVEIYEGDIIICVNGQIDVIEFGEFREKLHDEYDTVIRGIGFSFGGKYSFGHPMEGSKGYEVIGNIHQNPELLK